MTERTTTIFRKERRDSHRPDPPRPRCVPAKAVGSMTTAALCARATLLAMSNEVNDVESPPTAKRIFRAVSYEKLWEFSGNKPRDFGKADVVLLHCFLDNVLEGLLRRAFIRHRAVAEMFEPGRALWSFTTKVAVAFAMGLIADFERDDLLLVNKVRNRVAHNIRGATFRQPHMRQDVLGETPALAPPQESAKCEGAVESPLRF